MYGGGFRGFLSYFSVTSHLFPSYFSSISHFSVISYLFLENFSFPNYFWSISQSFLTSQLLLSYFSTISLLLLNYFSVTSRLFPVYSSSCRITCLSWFAQQCVLNEANETIRDYFQTEVVVASFYQLW